MWAFNLLKEMAMRLKDKKLRKMLEKGWITVDEDDAPSNEELDESIIKHNAAYMAAADKVWKQPPPAMDRRLPLVYQRDGYKAWWGGKDTETIPVAKVKADDIWHCDTMDVKGCPIAKAPQIVVPLEMYNIWTDLADRKDTEWIAYLIGTLD